MSDDLVERVARAINATSYNGCEPGNDEVRACVDPPCQCRAAARAFIALALEEAAKVADENKHFFGFQVAAAIRAMIPQEPA